MTNIEFLKKECQAIDVKLFIVPKWVMPFGYGLTLYNLIFAREDSSDINYVVNHELIHTMQWKRDGFFKFLYIYFKQIRKYGYKNAPYEVEARIAKL